MNRNARAVAIFAPLLAFAAACGSSRPTEPTGPVRVRTVVVLGDSLAISPSRSESFPAVLQARLTDRGLPWTMLNAGVSGDTTSGGLRRVDALLGEEVGVLAVALGANDGLRGVDVRMIEENLSAIIERAKARGIRVLLCGMETPPLRGWEYSVEFHRLFPRLASRHAVPLVPFLLAGVALDPGMNGHDGIHPNANGARRIAENVWPYLEPLVANP